MKRLATSFFSLFLALIFTVILASSVSAQVDGCALSGSSGGPQGGFDFVLIGYDDDYCYYSFTCHSAANCDGDIHMWGFEIEGTDY